MTITIRAMSSSDFSAWRTLFVGYLAFYQTEIPEDVIATTFERLIDPDHSQQNAFLAIVNDVPVGLVHYIYHPHNWKKEEVCYLQDLFVAANVRKSGIGETLIRAVYDAADANGTPSVYWMTQEFNYKARSLYDRVATHTPFIKYAR